MKSKFCKNCNCDRLAVEQKRTHGCTGLLMLMMLVPAVTLFVGSATDVITGFGAGVVTFFVSCGLMSAKSYRCGSCGSKV